ncbi:expressed unknown protein [Ectocarpus siliculosus]|uniref:Uncharacterized protein n=1 Tax=Ectocarpus siliculosus TaxID=2880 RepID=D7G7S4_ECTSI|nr:expressed unknown protein [Ectocarpus siliculosus]|eukprot:CBJ27805.1 expressed unknown protein [Ectocarpus siliculosus]
MVASQMFIGAAATLIASSTAFVAPMAVPSVATTTSSASLKMSAGSDYVATLPGAPFSDGKGGGAFYALPKTMHTLRAVVSRRFLSVSKGCHL